MNINDILHAGLNRVYTAAVVHIRKRGQVVYERAVGHPNPEHSDAPTRPDTLFDLASITKIFTATAFLALADLGHIEVNTPLSQVIPEFAGPRPIRPYEHPLIPGAWVTVESSTELVDAGQITFHHLLTHTSGLPAWRPLHTLPPEKIRAAVLNTPFAYPPGTHVVYSDIGFILIGWALEALTKKPLDQVIEEEVIRPLGLTSVHFRPKGRTNKDISVAATEVYPQQARRMWGEVHDENAWAMGGISGHAGLFATAHDVAELGQAWLDRLYGRGRLPLTEGRAQLAVREQAQEGDVRRGWGWALRSPQPAGFTYPLGERAFGHTGFTGTSLYIDPDRELVIVALTNRVYFGREAEPILQWRRALHETVIKDWG